MVSAPILTFSGNLVSGVYYTNLSGGFIGISGLSGEIWKSYVSRNGVYTSSFDSSGILRTNTMAYVLAYRNVLDASYVFSVVRVSGGVTSVSGVLSLVVDTVKPNFPTFSVSGGGTYLAPNYYSKNRSSIITLSGDTQATYTVTHLSGAAVIYDLSAVNASGGRVSFSYAMSSDSSFNYAITVRDYARNTVSGSVVLIISTVAPTQPQFLLNTNVDTYMSPSFYKNPTNGTITISGGRLFQYTANSSWGMNYSGTLNSSGVNILSYTNLSGTYTISGFQTDYAGNTSQRSIFTFTIHTTLPPNPVLSGIPALPYTFTTVSGGSLLFSGVSGNNYTISVSGTTFTTVSGGAFTSGNTMSYPYIFFNNGSYRFFVTQTNSIGNSSTASSPILTVTGGTTAYAYTSLATSADGNTIAVASADSNGKANVYISKDAGVSWFIANIVPSATSFQVACSSDGNRIVAYNCTTRKVRAYSSVDGGKSWTLLSTSVLISLLTQNEVEVVMNIGTLSPDGLTILYNLKNINSSKWMTYKGFTAFSNTTAWTTNVANNAIKSYSGICFTDISTCIFCTNDASSGIFIVSPFSISTSKTNGNDSFTSTNNTYVVVYTPIRVYFSGIAAAKHTPSLKYPTRIFAISSPGYIYRYTLSGAAIQSILTVSGGDMSGTNIWSGIACDASGIYVYACAGYVLPTSIYSPTPSSKTEYIYKSSDGGTTWTKCLSFSDGSPANIWTAIVCSSSGKNIAATTSSGKIYTSSDFGVSWYRNSISPITPTFGSISGGYTDYTAIVTPGLRQYTSVSNAPISIYGLTNTQYSVSVNTNIVQQGMFSTNMITYLYSLADGSYNIGAYMTDTIGIRSSTAYISFQMDTSMPGPSTLAPSNVKLVNGWYYTNVPTVVVKLNGGVLNNYYYFLLESTNVESEVLLGGSPTKTYTLPFDGSHNLSSYTIDLARNKSITTSIVMYRKTTMTATTITVPGNYYAGIYYTYNTSGSIYLSGESKGTLSIATGTGVMGQAYFLLDSSSSISTIGTISGVMNSSGIYSFGYIYVPQLASISPYTFDATVTDVAGNTSLTSVKLAFDYRIPNAPTLTSIPGIVSTNDSKRYLTVSSGTITFTSDIYTVYSISSSWLSSQWDSSQSGIIYSIPTSSLAFKHLTDGSYSFVINSTTLAGTTNISGTSLTFIVDSIAPSAPTFFGLPGYIANDAKRYTSSVSGSFFIQTAPYISYSIVSTWGLNNWVSPTSGITDSSGIALCSYTGLTDNPYIITVTVTKNNGLTNTASTSFTVDTVLPNIPIFVLPPGVLNADGNRYSSSISGTIAISCISPGFPYILTGSWPQSSWDSSSTGITDSSGFIYATYKQLVDGSYSLGVQLFDFAGNRSSSSLTWIVLIDPPLSPVVLTIPNVYSTNIVLNISGQPNTVLLATYNGRTTTLQTTNGIFSYTFLNLNEGIHTINLVSQNKANIYSSPVEFSWNTIILRPLTISTVIPTVTRDTSGTITFFGDAGHTFSVTNNYNFSYDGSIDSFGDGSFSYSNLPDGDVAFTIITSDGVNATGYSSILWTVRTFLSAPIVSGLPTTLYYTGIPVTHTPSGTLFIYSSLADISYSISDVETTFHGSIDSSQNASYLYSFDSDGIYTLTIQLLDSIGNTSTTIVSIYLKRSITSPSFVFEDSVLLDDIPYTNNRSSTILLQGEPYASYIIQSSIGSAFGIFDSSGLFSYRYSILYDASYSIHVTTSDVIGNNAIATYTFVVKTFLQTPILLSNIGTLAPNGLYYSKESSNTIYFSGEPAAYYTITGSFSISDSFDTSGNANFTYTNVEDGTYTILLASTDFVGNNSSLLLYSWILDTDIPSVPVLSNYPFGTSAIRDWYIAIYGEANSYWGIQLEYAGRTTAYSGSIFSSGISYFDISGLLDGNYTLYAQIIDYAGNTSSNVMISWIINTGPPPAPTLYCNVSGITSSTNIQISISGELGLRYTLYINGVIESSDIMFTNTEEYSLTNPIQTTYSIFATFQNDSNLQSVDSNVITFHVVYPIPPAPTLSRIGTQLTISGEDGYTYNLISNNSIVSSGSSTGNSIIDISGYGIGSYSFYATLTDTVYNTVSPFSNMIIYIVNAPTPAAPSLSLSDTVLTISGESGYTCTLISNNQIVNTFPLLETFLYDLSGVYSVGNYSFYATLADQVYQTVSPISNIVIYSNIQSGSVLPEPPVLSLLETILTISGTPDIYTTIYSTNLVDTTIYIPSSGFITYDISMYPVGTYSIYATTIDTATNTSSYASNIVMYIRPYPIPPTVSLNVSGSTCSVALASLEGVTFTILLESSRTQINVSDVLQNGIGIYTFTNIEYGIYIVSCSITDKDGNTSDSTVDTIQVPIVLGICNETLVWNHQENYDIHIVNTNGSVQTLDSVVGTNYSLNMFTGLTIDVFISVKDSPQLYSPTVTMQVPFDTSATHIPTKQYFEVALNSPTPINTITSSMTSNPSLFATPFATLEQCDYTRLFPRSSTYPLNNKLCTIIFGVSGQNIPYEALPDNISTILYIAGAENTSTTYTILGTSYVLSFYSNYVRIQGATYDIGDMFSLAGKSYILASVGSIVGIPMAQQTIPPPQPVALVHSSADDRIDTKLVACEKKDGQHAYYTSYDERIRAKRRHIIKNKCKTDGPTV